MNFTKSFFIFLTILTIAIFFRFYRLSSVPPSPSLDEVTIGYNAYSLLHTGRDEYGYKFPILLRAYDDFRPALYVYMVIPFVKIFGLNVLAVRLPSAILSVVTVIASYFLTKEIFRKYKYKNAVSLLAMFFIAISPWHIYISRLGHEANPGSTLGVLGSLFFLHSLSDIRKKWFILLSAFFFSLALYTYQSEKVFIPLLVFILIILYWKKILRFKKGSGIAFILGVILTIPIFLASISPQGLSRFSGTSAFSSQIMQSYQEQSSKQLIIDRQTHNILAEVIDNRRLVPVRIFLSNYFSHFNIYWLFSNIGMRRFKAPDQGLLYWWELPVLILGFIYLIKINLELNSKLLIIFWIAIAFIAPSITTQAPHAMRSFTVIPMPEIIAALGFAQSVIFLFNKKNIFLKSSAVLFTVIFLLIVGFSAVVFWIRYFILFPEKDSGQFQYALYQSVKYVIKNEQQYKKIIVSNKDNLYQSYMFYLFASKYDPEKYLSQGGTKSGGFAEFHEIGKIDFRPINWLTEKIEPKTLFVGNISDFPTDVSPVETVNYLDGTVGVKIVNR